MALKQAMFVSFNLVIEVLLISSASNGGVSMFSRVVSIS